MLAVVAIALAMTVARPHGTPGPIMRDFESYYAAGQAFAARQNPYSTNIWRFEQRVPGVDPARGEVLPFVGPPAFLPLWALFGALPFTTAALLWGALLVILAGLFVVVVLSKAKTLSAGTLAAAAALLVAFGPFTGDLALGQAAWAAFVACTGAAVMLDRSRAVAGIWTFFCALQPNVALLLILQSVRRGALVVFGIAAAAFAILSVVCAGFSGALAYLPALRAHAAAERFVIIQVTPAAIAYGFGIPPAFASAIGLFAALVAVVLCVALVRNATIGPLWKLAVACALLPFGIPFFHEHDFVVLLLPVLLCLTADDPGAWSLAAAGTMLVAIDWLGLAQRPEAFAQMLLLAVALLGAMYALADVPLRRVIAPACILPLLVAAYAIAAHAAAPIWPDAMHGTPQLSGTIASAWHDELQRTGQFAVQPVWAGLRLLTLLGCALLARAAYLIAASRTQFEML